MENSSSTNDTQNNNNSTQKKLPKELIIFVGVALLLCIVLVIIACTGNSDSKKAEQTAEAPSAEVTETTTVVADVDPIDLPDKTPLSEILGFEPMQVEKLSDKYVLRYVETLDRGVTYKYQTHLSANSTRLYLRIYKMSEEDFYNTLPAESVSETVEIDGRTATFADRLLYKFPEEELPLDETSIPAQQAAKGEAVIVKSDMYRELSNMQTLDWYENGCKYEIYADYLNLSKDEMVELAHNYFTYGE
jgi:hypothetical protein